MLARIDFIKFSYFLKCLIIFTKSDWVKFLYQQNFFRSSVIKVLFILFEKLWLLQH